MSHTPGPWTANRIGLSIFVVPEDRKSSEIIGVCKLGSDSRGAYLMPYEDNARLIAASPSLLFALKDLVIQIQLKGRADEYNFEHVEEALDMAEDQI